MGIVADLIDLFESELIAQPVVRDSFGEFIASGELMILPCHIEGESRMTRDSTGREVVSSMQAIVAGYNNLSTEGYVYTLPSGLLPRTNLQAVAIEKAFDEDGECYETVMFL